MVLAELVAVVLDVDVAVVEDAVAFTGAAGRGT